MKNSSFFLSILHGRNRLRGGGGRERINAASMNNALASSVPFSPLGIFVKLQTHILISIMFSPSREDGARLQSSDEKKKEAAFATHILAASSFFVWFGGYNAAFSLVTMPAFLYSTDRVGRRIERKGGGGYFSPPSRVQPSRPPARG